MNHLDQLLATLPDKPLLRIGEVAKFFDCTTRTIYAWYPEILKGTNVNGVIRIYRWSVVEVVKKNNGRKGSDEAIIEDNLIRPRARRVLSEGVRR